MLEAHIFINFVISSYFIKIIRERELKNELVCWKLNAIFCFVIFSLLCLCVVVVFYFIV